MSAARQSSGETQYAFRHVLVRDVAYGQIPRAVRGEKHVGAADWIESLGRADDHAELVSHHLAAAAELGVEVGDRARLTYRRAGDRARALGAWPAAERYYAQALESWPVEDADYPRLVAAHATARARATGDTEQLGAALDALEAAGLWEEGVQFAAAAAMTVWYATGDPRAFLERGLKLLEGRPPFARPRGAACRERAHPLVPRRVRPGPEGTGGGGRVGGGPGLE